MEVTYSFILEVSEHLFPLLKVKTLFNPFMLFKMLTRALQVVTSKTDHWAVYGYLSAASLNYNAIKCNFASVDLPFHLLYTLARG